MARLLDGIQFPKDIRGFTIDELNQLAVEMREEVISVVSEVGGHFASTLGAVELTLALHYVFNTPEDRIVWDTGHQTYAHKLISGRRDRLGTIRQLGGLSGFLSRDESEYDVFGAGHAGTSISAALGMVEAKYLEGSKRKVVAVMSDGGLSAGLIYEGLNSAGHLDRDLIVVLNDNEHFIDPRVGAVSSFLSKQFTTDLGVRLQRNLSNLLRSLPSGENLKHVARKIRDSFLGLVTPGFLFESLGFQYVGPIDGHNISEMITTLENVKKIEGPTLVHVTTVKGKGYPPAEKEPIKFHAVTPFHVLTGKAKKEKGPIPTYTDVFGRSLLDLAKQNRKIVGITAAMGSGTGIDKLAREIPERTYDVGIAEQHAVTFAGGMATEGYVPVVAVYSTFLQRGYDEILHDVCLQNLHVVFALDRGGLVGADGPTHHGVFDFSYMRSMPNLVVMAPKDENELQHMLKTAVDYCGPISLRYPRGEGWGVDLDGEMQNLEIGKAELLRDGTDVVIVAIGQPVIPALRAAQDLAPLGINAAVVNARFVKPLDKDLFRDLFTRIPRLISVEDHVTAGGFGSAMVEMLADEGLTGVEVRRLGVPDRFIPHGTQDELRKMCGFDKDAIAQAALQMARRAKKKSREGWERGSA
ncbi:MAG TPA: 1-deoxy-D-xylulose-5-phosphate synthase [Candidatus Binatia bacterium]|jgi:1-deoxy-D-xylulose-5-phosphate synthase|nr:1-deoxy-D-xylulose-5-phosphate synthase [Candidatus Binatia bacterium]